MKKSLVDPYHIQYDKLIRKYLWYKTEIWRSVAGQPRFMSWILLVENWNVRKSPIFWKKTVMRHGLLNPLPISLKGSILAIFYPTQQRFFWGFKMVNVSTVRKSSKKIHPMITALFFLVQWAWFAQKFPKKVLYNCWKTHNHKWNFQ